MTELWSGESKNLTAMASGGKIVTAKYRLTTDYLYIDTGLLSTKGEQIPLWAIRDCDLSQSLVQKARGVGDLKITCQHNDFTGKQSVVLESIEGARDLRDLINREAKRARVEYETQQKAQTMTYVGQPPSSQPAAKTSDDSMEKLEKLAAMFEKGLLSEDEFKAQKSKLLGL